MAELNMKIEWETRLCKVDGKLGYFHTWEQWSGNVNGSQLSRVYGIVEFKGCIRRIDPEKIKFCDEQNAMLVEMEEAIKKVEEWEGETDA